MSTLLKFIQIWKIIKLSSTALAADRKLKAREIEPGTFQPFQAASTEEDNFQLSAEHRDFQAPYHYEKPGADEPQQPGEPIGEVENDYLPPPVVVIKDGPIDDYLPPNVAKRQAGRFRVKLWAVVWHESWSIF